MSETGATTPRTRLRPVERFLGPAEGAGGPFALLALTPDRCDEGDVLFALERQLERVNTHAQCDTPEADEVRLALHAAAAQLLDPIVRRHLIARWSGVSPARAQAGAPQPPAPPRLVFPPPQIDAMRLLEHDAILTLGVLGWNQHSLRRLATLAHARGLTNQQVATALRGLTRTRRPRPAPVPVAPNGVPHTAHAQAAPAPVAPAPPGTVEFRARAPVIPEEFLPPEHFAAQADPSQLLLKRALLIGGAGLLSLVGLAVLIIVLTQPKPAPKPVPPLPGGLVATGTTGASPTSGPGAAAAAAPPVVEPVQIPRITAKPAKPTAPPDPSDLASIGRELAAAAGAVQSDPDAALARFSATVAKLAAGWPAMPHDRLVSAHDSVLEFIYRAGSNGDVVAKAFEAIARGARASASPPLPPEQVLPSVWSTGMLVRLTREKDLAASAREAVDGALGAALGASRPTLDPSFDAGASAMLHALPRRLIPAGGAPGAEIDPEAWQQWAKAAEAVAAGDGAARNRVLLAGLETLLVSGPEPNQSRSTGTVIARLVEKITWRAEDDSRRWLLRWFNDRRLTAADLNAVTSALATRSSAEGVELTMVLSTSASDRVRADLRDRYATVWNIQDQAQRDDLTTAWLKAAHDAIDQSLSGGGELDQLERTVLLARLNESAWLQWRGNGAEGAAIVVDLRGPIEAAKGPPPARAPGATGDGTDGGWAEKYLAAKQAKARKELLDQLKGTFGSELGPVDAEVLVGEALTGTPDTLRSAAVELVHQFSAAPTIINAVLERLPRVARTAQSAALIEYVCSRQLPGLRDPQWPIVARRGLIERLVEAKAAEGPMARADRLATLLAVSYRGMASSAPLAPDERAQATQPAAYLSAGQLWASWREAADKLVPVAAPPVRLDEVERRRDGRRSLARGLVQTFAAEQASLAELMAYVVGAEKVGKSDDVRTIVARLAEDRRRSSSILEQLMATERAMTQLWLIRLAPEEEPPA